MEVELPDGNKGYVAAWLVQTEPGFEPALLLTVRPLMDMQMCTWPSIDAKRTGQLTRDTLLTVLHDGDLYPCRRMPIRVGNLLEASLTELYNTFDRHRAHRDLHHGIAGCNGCFYAGLCRGGLKCLSYAVTGDPFTADPGCWRTSQRLHG